MMSAMTFEEAFDQALNELSHRSEQMTAVEFQELIQDRSRELMGLPKMARLKSGQRLRPEDWMRLQVACNNYLSDFEHVAMLGDARLRGESTLIVMFRLSARPDISYSIEVWLSPMNYTEAGQHAAVNLYDALTPKVVERLIAGKPL